jgi:dolichol-phosphate mannosyltransferase
LVPALAAWLTVVLTFCFAARVLGNRAGLLAGLSLALLAGFTQCGRFLIIDGVLTLTIAGGLCAGYLAVRATPLRWSWWLVAAACCALAVLAKGPIGVVLIAIPLMASTYLDRRLARPGVRHWTFFALLLFALATPWYVAMTIREPAFAREFLLEHHLLRFLGPDFHAEPCWFYVPVVLVGCLPWTFLLWPALRFVFDPSPAAAALRPRGLGFCVVWAGWCFVFFSLSRGKLPTYILPATPALAILLGWYLELAVFRNGCQPLMDRVRRWGPVLALGFVGVACLAGAWIGTSKGLVSTGHRPLVLVGAVVCLVVALAILSWRRCPVVPAWSMAAVAAFGFMVELTQYVVPAWAGQRSPLAGAGQVIHDHRSVFVCDGLGEEWGSVTFAIDHDGAFMHVKGHTDGAVRAFVSSHSRSWMFTKADAEPDRVQPWIPADHRICQRIASGKAVILDLEPIKR